MASNHGHGKSDLKIGLVGLFAGAAWIAIVAVFAYNLAAH